MLYYVLQLGGRVVPGESVVVVGRRGYGDANTALLLVSAEIFDVQQVLPFMPRIENIAYRAMQL